MTVVLQILLGLPFVKAQRLSVFVACAQFPKSRSARCFHFYEFPILIAVLHSTAHMFACRLGGSGFLLHTSKGIISISFSKYRLRVGLGSLNQLFESVILIAVTVVIAVFVLVVYLSEQFIGVIGVAYAHIGIVARDMFFGEAVGTLCIVEGSFSFRSSFFSEVAPRIVLIGISSCRRVGETRFASPSVLGYLLYGTSIVGCF